MKKIFLSIILFLSYTILSTSSYIMSFKKYIETNFKDNVEISLKNGFFKINDQNFTIYDFLELEISQIHFLIANIAFLSISFFLIKKSHLLTNLRLKKPNLSEIKFIFFVMLFIISIEYAINNISIINKFDSFKFNNNTFNNILILVNLVIFIPLIEEIIFRYLLLNGLIEQLNNKNISILISSFIFTIIHLQYDILPLSVIFLFSISISYIYKKFNNFYTPFLLHSINNLITLIFILIYQ